jgi:DNA-binding transcriptional regulator of glucitol operon
MVVLVVDRAKREIVRADAMTGYTVFARFKPRPELIGSVAQAKERAGSRALREGVANALLQLPPASVPRKVAPAAPTAKPKPRATGAGA